MAEGISEKMKDPKFISVSTSAYCTYHLTQFRNADSSAGFPEVFGRRALAEAGYLFLAVASLIETAIRALIGAVAAPFIQRMEEESEFKARVIKLCLHGSIYTAENFVIAVAALVPNVLDAHMSYDKIVPAIKEGNKYLVLQGILES